MQKIRLITNVGKSQISENADFFFLKKIPVTVDGAVMNGLLYTAEANAEGMPSINGRAMTLGHPKNDAGEFISASEGEALVNHFSGGSVEKNYHVNGVHYVDAKIKKSVLKAQTNGEWYFNQLESRKPIGVSTGLFSERTMGEGVNNSGQKYYAIANGQKYDHLALLHESEAPAGGKDTFINFNAEQGEMIVNLDSFIDDDEPLINRIVARVASMFGNDDKTRYNQNDDVISVNELNTNEDDQMRTVMLANMKAKGIEVNADITDADLLVKYEASLTANKATFIQGEPADHVPEWAKKLSANMEDMSKKMSAIEKKELTAEEEEKAKKAKAVAANSALGLTEDEAKLLPNALLDKFFAQSGGIAGNAMATNSLSTAKSSFDDYIPE